MSTQMDYLPSDQWPSLNVLDGGGFKDNDLPESDALAGRTFELALEGAGTLRLDVAEGGTVRWARTGADGREQSGEDQARIAENGDGLFLLTWIRGGDSERADVVVLDTGAGLATVVHSVVDGDDEAGRTVTGDLLHGRIAGVEGGAESSALHARTDELVGKRVQYVYGPDNAYEHVYLHEGAYAWQCLAGAEKGLADVDWSRTVRIAEGVYLFVWREKVVPCEGIVLINFAAHRSTGRIFGWDTEAREHNAVQMGAVSKLLSETHHDPADWA